MEETTPVKRLKNSLTKQNLWLYILSTLRRKKVYAYGLGAEMEKRFGWKHGLITTYVVLYKLEAEGLIASEYKERRKYYAITAKGRKALREAKEYLKRLAASL